jgi:serine phosphatase RsbU (regulator of sigma subunit)
MDQMAWWWFYYCYPSRILHGVTGLANATVPIAAFWPVWRVPRELRTIYLVAVLWASGEAANSAPRLPWLASVDATGWLRNYRALATTPAIIAMFFLLARRQKRITEERAELKTEMLAAQEMQRLLVPESLDLEPWITVDVAYAPAKEVGGDFYFCRRTAVGQLIVIGDVSGKGLRAAMMASTLVGALRNETCTDPGQILVRMNAVVIQANSGGFVTCLCTLFQSDGTLRFANAGHISPYLSGHETEGLSGLPLGLSLEADYKESLVETGAGTVTLLSDGVLEARNEEGELLGFERMAALTPKTAEEISEAAQLWGQEDDITVLTVRSAAA